MNKRRNTKTRKEKKPAIEEPGRTPGSAEGELEDIEDMAQEQETEGEGEMPLEPEEEDKTQE